MTVPHSPTDRRVVIAGMRVATMVTARLLAGQLLAMLASAATIAGLAVRTGIDVPARVAAGTLMFAVTYLAIGAVVGATVRNPVNGTVLIMFVWIIDVFFGPTLSSPDGRLIRAFPTHFTSLWLVDLPSLHGGLGHLPSRVRRRPGHHRRRPHKRLRHHPAAAVRTGLARRPHHRRHRAVPRFPTSGGVDEAHPARPDLPATCRRPSTSSGYAGTEDSSLQTSFVIDDTAITGS